jgi:rod shape-determining protein MreB and related proteins
LSISDKLIKLIADPDLALDLGNANTRLYALGKGLICDEPSVVRLSPGDTSIGMGRRHFTEMSSRGMSSAPSMTPLTGGVVTNVSAATELLAPFIRRARLYGLSKPRVLACAPSDASPREVAALVTAVTRAGASSVKVVREPQAAAVGAGLDISLPYAQMLIDIGDGVTDIAVIRSGQLIKTAAVRSACRDIYAMIQSLVAKRYNVILYWREVERLAGEVGLAQEVPSRPPSIALGLDRSTGHEKEMTVSDTDVSDAIEPVVRKIRETLRAVIRHLPHDSAAEVIESGVCLTGGGTYLQGMKEMIAAETSLDVRIAPDPLRAVINGAGQMLAVGAETGLWRM